MIAMSRVIGHPIGRHGASELVASIAGVVGWGVLAQQLVLGLYKTVLPFLGAFTTIPLVYAATFALGHAAKAVLDARRRDQELSRAEIRRIAKEAAARAKSEKRDWSFQALTAELQEWKQRAQAYQDYVAKDAALSERIRELEALAREPEELKRRIAALERELASTIPEHELAEVVAANDALRLELETIRKQRAQDPRIENELARSRGQREKILRDRVKKCYPSLRLEDRVLRDAARLEHKRLHAMERELALLQYDPGKASFRSRIQGSAAEELKFADDGRLYIVRHGASISVVRVGEKASQQRDIDWLRTNHPS